MASANLALGILEVRGMVALAAAVDVMFKAATVRLVGRHQIGSGWLTIVIDGPTDDVQTAIDAGRTEAARHGDVITAAVIPRAEADALGGMPHHGTVDGIAAGNYEALGILETKGVVPLVAGTDAMVKAGDVTLAGWTFIGGALVHSFVTGSVGDVEAAIAAGERAARRAGEFHGALVLSQPEAEIAALFPPALQSSGDGASGALGVVETTGYAGAVAGSDVMVKEADVDLIGQKIGSGGRVATLVRGRLDEITTAVQRGAAAAGAVAELNGQLILPGADGAVLAAFSQPAAAAPERPHAGEALGLVETRTTIGLVKALDEMLKNADVTYEGRHKVGYFLTACVVRGDIGAVETALDIARDTVGKYGELVAAHTIALPYDTLQARLPHA